jgi:hypothetical protein
MRRWRTPNSPALAKYLMIRRSTLISIQRLTRGQRGESLHTRLVSSNYYSLDFPKEIRKQKRSTPRRREGPLASINVEHKMNWLSDTSTKQDHLKRDQGAQVAANPPDKKEKRTSLTRKTTRKSVSISLGRQLFSEPQTNQSAKPQPSSRRGKGKKQPHRYNSCT